MKPTRRYHKNSMKKQSIQACSALGLLLLCAHVEPASAQSLSIPQLLRALNSVHPVGEVAISPDGKHLVYGNVVSGKRDDAEIDVSALWIVNAKDGSGALRLTACPGSVCDEHGAAWSADGKQIVFVTTDAQEQ